MPVIVKKCFLYHYNPAINSDKVFNLFLIDNQNGTYSAISEHGRSGTKLRVLPLARNCSLALAQNRYSEKRTQKVFHKETPYTETFNCPDSPTLKKFETVAELEKPASPATVINFKPAAPDKANQMPAEKESGKQNASEINERRSKQIGVLNLERLDALEF